MVLPDPYGYAHARVTGTVDGASAGVGFWLPVSSEVTVDNCNDYSGDFLTQFNDTFLADMSDSASTEACTVTAYNSPSGPIVQGFTLLHSVGGSGTGNFAASTAAVISWKQGTVYRGGKPRTYLWGPPLGQALNSKQWTSGYVSALTSFANDFLAGVNGIVHGGLEGPIGLLRRISGGAPLGTPEFEPFIAGECQARICSQRRRLGKLVAE